MRAGVPRHTCARAHRGPRARQHTAWQGTSQGVQGRAARAFPALLPLPFPGGPALGLRPLAKPRRSRSRPRAGPGWAAARAVPRALSMLGNLQLPTWPAAVHINKAMLGLLPVGRRAGIRGSPALHPPHPAAGPGELLAHPGASTPLARVRGSAAPGHRGPPGRSLQLSHRLPADGPVPFPPCWEVLPTAFPLSCPCPAAHSHLAAGQVPALRDPRGQRVTPCSSHKARPGGQAAPFALNGAGS